MGNKRIALNTFFTIGQSLIAMVCGLFTGRWVLNALGHEGFGVFSVVGGVMVFVLFLNSVLTNSACRHFAYAIGKTQMMPELDRLPYLGQWFTASLYVHLLLPVLLCGIGFFVGEWYIANKLVVAESMRGECFWVFRFSLVSAFFSIVAAPYFAIYTARQLIFVRTIFSFGSTILNAFGSYALFFFDSDRIFWHALILMCIQVLTTILITLCAIVKFPETRQIKNGIKFEYVRELFTFGGAQMLGMFANMLRDQGMAIVVNRFSGLKVNAAIGLGSQVTNKTSIFATSAMSALLPEVTSCLASSNFKRARSIAEKANLFIPISYALFIFPVLSNVDYILHLWLGNPPESAATFCGISLFMLYIDSLTCGYQQLINANGRIFAYQMTAGCIIASSVVLAFCLYLIESNAVFAVGAGVLAPTAGLVFVRLIFMRCLFGMGPKKWLFDVLLPTSVVLLVSWTVSYLFVSYFQKGLMQFLILGLVNCAVVILTSMVVISSDDRQFLCDKLVAVKRKILTPQG